MSGRSGAKLQTVDPVFGRPLDVRARLLRRIDAALVPAAARTLVVEDPRRDDLVLRAAFLVFHRQRVAAERDAANGGHAMREPQLVGVLGFLVLGRAAGMDVHIDEARHQVHAGRVDLVVRLRRPVLAERQSGRAGAADRR